MLAIALFLLGTQSAFADEPDAEPDVEAGDDDTLLIAVPTRNRATYTLGDGIAFTFDDGRHAVGITGFVQPSWQIATDGQGGTPSQIWSARRAQLGVDGSFEDGLYGFTLLTDFSLSAPLLEAGAHIRLHEALSIGIGQLQTPTNNREMLLNEGDLAMPERGAVSQAFSETGRELGLFVNGDVDIAGVVIRPQAALTSGDGRNSFGTDSRDPDLGAMKWGGRLDVYPMGDFSEGNRETIFDRIGERQPRLVVGGAFSFNDGASQSKGEGHGDFLIYDGQGDPQLPDYLQFHADALLKVRGLSVLVEYSNAAAKSLQGTFTDTVGGNPLVATQISELLVLGNAVGIQAGYFAKPGVSFDVRYTALLPEFTENTDSVLKRADVFAGGLTFYVHDPGARIQTAFTYTDGEDADIVQGEVAAIVRF